MCVSRVIEGVKEGGVFIVITTIAISSPVMRDYFLLDRWM